MTYEVAVTLAGAGLLMLALAWAGYKERLHRNPIAGIRLRSTMRSPEAWAAGHRAATSATAAGGVAALAGAVVALLVGSDGPRDVAPAVVALLTAGAMIGCVVVAAARAVDAADRVNRRAG